MEKYPRIIFKIAKKPPSGSGRKSKLKYYLADYLEFILPYTKNKGSTGNLESLLNTNNDDSEEENSDSETIIEDQNPNSQSQGVEKSQDVNVPNTLSDPATTHQNVNFSVTNRDEASATPVNSAKKRKISHTTPTPAPNPVDNAFLEWLKNKTEKQDLKKEDPSMSFFRSLSPDIHKMTDKQNRRFRQKVIALIDEILDDGDTPSYSNLSSWSSSSKTSAERYTIPCQTPSPNTPIAEWHLEEPRAQMSGSFRHGQNVTRDDELPWYTKY